MFAVVACLFILLLTLIYFWIQKKYKFWEERGIEYLKPVVFPFGNLKGVGYEKHLSEVTKNAYKIYKGKTPIVGLYFYTAPIIYVLDLELVNRVLVKDFNKFHDRGMYYNKKDDPLSAHLFALRGMEWKNMRAKLTPTFTSGKMKMMFNTVVIISNQMIEFMKKSTDADNELEMKEMLSRFTTDVIGNVAFGLDVNSMENPNSKFREMGRKFFSTPPLRTLKVLFTTVFPEMASKLKMKIIDDDVTEFFLKSLQETIEYREKNNVQRNDFMNLIIQIKNHGKIDDDHGESLGTITFEELAAQCFLFFLAGFETSSTTMMFCLYELAQNQEIQDKLRKEITSILESTDDGQLNYEKMVQMKYLQMVIDETLRKFPPVDVLMRFGNEDYKIPDTELTLPAKTLIFIPIRAIQMDPANHPDPDKFDPERFTEENKKKRHPMTHLPFGDGPRNCLGLRFGLMQTKIGLIQLLPKFKFSVCSRTTIPMKFVEKNPLLTPKNDMWLKVEKV